jgi:small-conductance mechanosensitive channel
VRRLLREAALACPAVEHEREPAVHVTRFGDFAVILQLVFWVRDYLEQPLARSEVHEEIDRRLRAAGIEMPLPIRTVVQEGAARSPRSPQEV